MKENEILIARFNKILDQKLTGNGAAEAAALPAADRESLRVAERLRQVDFSIASPIKGALWEKLLAAWEEQVRERPEISGDELDEDQLYQATGGVKPPPSEGPDQN
ncbi:MAG: hypothetical protein PVH64_01410 [Bacillota bacterium]